MTVREVIKIKWEEEGKERVVIHFLSQYKNWEAAAEKCKRQLRPAGKGKKITLNLFNLWSSLALDTVSDQRQVEKLTVKINPFWLHGESPDHAPGAWERVFW